MNKILLLIAMFGLIGCGGFDSSNGANNGGSLGNSLMSRKPYGTCDRKTVATTNLCMEAVGTDYNEPGYLGILESSCESSGGTYSSNTCDTTGAFGICVVNPGASNATYISYYAPTYDADSAREACSTAGGLFF